MASTKSFMHPAATSEERKASPIASGFDAYFPAATELVARLSKFGNDKHNPGMPIHWSRGKSDDHADCLRRHQLEVGTIDPDTGFDHAVAVAWRAMAQLQLLAENKYGHPTAPGANAPAHVGSGATLLGRMQAAGTPAVTKPPVLYTVPYDYTYLYEAANEGESEFVQIRCVATYTGQALNKAGAWFKVRRDKLQGYR